MKFRWFVSTLVLVSIASAAFAQFDDLYYDPKSNTSIEDPVAQQYNSTTQYSGYDDDSYEYYDEYDDGYYEDYDDYQYSSRIRRFYRPSYSIGYYSPLWAYSWRDPYWDPWYNSWYDPWYGGNSVVVVVGNGGWGSWNRWNRWNNWSCGYNNWGYNNWGWGNNYYVNNYYGYGGWNNPWYGNHGHGNHYNGGGNNNNNNNHPYGTYYGSRKSGSSVASTKGRIEGPRKDVSPRDVSPEAHNPADVSQGNGDRPSISTRQRKGDYDPSTKPEERSSIYNRKRSDVSGPGSGSSTYPGNTEPGRRSDVRPQMDKQSEADRPKRDNNRSQEPRSYERPRSNDNNRSSGNENRSSRSYDSGSRNSGGSSGGSSSRSSSGGSGGSSSRGSSSPRKGG
ncbi:MAG: hypothetical protein IPN73_03275 [Saprospiraceae bacterium]|nr:hypothetical protein [Saprospiraceae bacterium]